MNIKRLKKNQSINQREKLNKRKKKQYCIVTHKYVQYELRHICIHKFTESTGD